MVSWSEDDDDDDIVRAAHKLMNDFTAELIFGCSHVSDFAKASAGFIVDTDDAAEDALSWKLVIALSCSMEDGRWKMIRFFHHHQFVIYRERTI